MPNHFHGIIQIVGADLCVGPDTKCEILPRMMKWFKSQTTNAYLRGIKQSGWGPFIGSLWQRSYHDRIIRSEEELCILRAYIKENPEKWQEDNENPNKGRHTGRPLQF
jgi:REP element-mobilizing transposase RayT